MKKLSLLLAMGLLVTGLVACGNREESGTSTESTQSTELQESTSTQSSEAESQESTESEPESGEASDGMDVSGGWSEELTAVRQAIVDTLGDEYWPNTAMEPEILEGLVGIASDLYDDYLAEMPMISTNVDTLLIIRPKDGKVEDVETALNAYRDRLVNDTMQYPMNLSKIQASRIEVIGDYVCFVQLGGSAVDIEDEETAIAECLEQNELVIELIRQNVQS